MKKRSGKWSEECRPMRQEKARLFAAGRFKELAEKAVDLGDVLMLNDAHEEAVREFEEALQHREEDRQFVATTRRKLGDAYMGLLRFSEARVEFQEYLTISQGLQMNVEIQRAFTSMGRAFHDEACEMAKVGWEDDPPRLQRFKQVLAEAQKYCQLAQKAIGKIVDPKCNETEKKEMEVIVCRNLTGIAKMEGHMDRWCQLIESGERLCSDKRAVISNYLVDFKVSRFEWLQEKGDLPGALEVCQYLARKDPAQLEWKIQSTLLSSRLALGQKVFDEAHKFLYQAFKLAGKAKDARRTMWEADLKRLVKIRKALKQMQSWPLVGQHKDKSHLLESVGDKLCDMAAQRDEAIYKSEAWLTAIWYYRESLSHAEQCEGDQEWRASLISSMATTYKDLQDYESAFQFYHKELLLRAPTGKEPINCLIVLCQCAQKLNKPYTSCLGHLEKALALAKQMESKAYQAKVLAEMIDLQSSYGMKGEAKETQVEKEALGGVDELEEVEDSQPNAPSSDSDVSDFAYGNEQNEKSTSKRGRRRILKIVNSMGETILHEKCQHPDNLEVIRSLVEKGHPVDHPDYSGFMPLHEAANHNQADYIQVLVENGANVNVLSKNRVSPLMSACVEGNLACIEVLLNYGAKVEAQDKNGWNPLDHLESWFSNDPLLDNHEMQNQCQQLITQMSTKLKTIEESGVNIRPIPKSKFLSEAFLNAGDENHKSPASEMSNSDRPPRDQRSQRRPLRERNIDSSSGEDSDREPANVDQSLRRRSRPTLKSGKSAAEYKSAIQGLKPNRAQKTQSKSSFATQKRYLGVDQPQALDEDDWLEDDVVLQRRAKRPKTDQSQINLSRRSREKANGTQGEAPSADPAGKSEPHLATDVQETVKKEEHRMVIKLKVWVEERSFMIPVTNRDWTFKDLSCEVSRRYRSSTGKKPVLKLTTSDRAELLGSDQVSLLLNDGDELHSVITDWIVDPLDEKYRDECKAKGLREVANVTQALREASLSQSFRLSCSLRGHHSDPMFKALQWESGLKELILPSNRLGEQGFKHLSHCLATLPNLEKLDLSSNGITPECTKSLAGMAKVDKLFKCLKVLHLSFNPLCDKSASSMADLCLHADQLEELNLQATCLSSDFFLHAQAKWCQLLPKLKLINLCCNHIDRSGQNFIESQVSIDCRAQFCHK